MTTMLVLGMSTVQAGASTNVVVMLGDSTTQCIYNKPGCKLTELVQARLNDARVPVRVVNSGVGGDTARGGLSRLQKDVLAHQPAVVTISFGLNDTGNLTPAEYREAMEKIILGIRQQSTAKILLVTSTPFNNARHAWKALPQARGDLDGYLDANYCATVRELARKRNLALCDLHEHWAVRFKQNQKLVDELILPDGVHLTDQGAQDAAEFVASAIVGLLAAGHQPRAEKAVALVLPPDASPVIRTLGDVLARQIRQRCEAQVVPQGVAPFTMEMALEPGIGREGFRIEDGKEGAVRIVGNDERGLVAGAGKFLRASRYDQGGFTPGAWRGTSVPQKPVRGIYFATHFHNYYHEAPVEEIGRYVEDLALWGLNELVVWYDMHHFNGPGDPRDAAFRTRLHAIMTSAKLIGMDVSLLVIGNEAYGNSPAELRATPGGGRGGYYPCAVCPSKAEGMAYLLKILGAEFDWAADLKPRSVWIWPYDQGGCGCAACKPWGAKGFMKCVEEVGRLARQKMPGTQIVLSTWYMDQAELAAVMKQLGEQKDLVDGLVNEGSVLPAVSGLGAVDGQGAGGAAGPSVLRRGLPVLGFPEISMHNTFPWGGFGATPLTGRAQGQWDAQKQKIDGAFPYSEGIYEDITKIVYSQFYWSDQPAAETVKEYIAFEFSPDVVADVAGVVKTLEQNHHMRWWPGLHDGVPLEMNWLPSKGVQPQADPGAGEAYAVMQQVDARLTSRARKSWRWRQLYLRALLDAELKANGGKPNERCNEAFAELIKLYHAENASGTVRPPLPIERKLNQTMKKEINPTMKKEMMKIGNASLTVVVGARPSPAEKRLTELLAERVQDRAGIHLAGAGDKASLRLVIGTTASNEKIKAFAATHKEVAALGADGYVIAVEPGKPELYVAGQSDSGVVAGVGRLMREMRYQPSGIEVPALFISESPQMPNRGMYLWARKHFFGKPDQVERYIEEFALWGCNGICFWFEMGLFKSFEDPEAQQWIGMYNRFYATARRLGMKTGLLMVANDAYGSSPEALRHTMIIGNHGREHYLCPSKPGSVAQLIAWQEQVFKALPGIDIFNIFPADPGGCACPDCTPWPTRGFWKVAKPLGDRIHELSPNTEIWIDTWHVNHPTFGDKDWKNLVANLDWSKERPEWFAGFEVGIAPKHGYVAMSAEERQLYNDAKQPLMVFPEISMWGNHKGMLVNKEYWRSLQAELNGYDPTLMKGGWPYSERWNTDIISVMFLSWFWNPKKSVETVLEEYASFYFGPEAVAGRELLDLLDDSQTAPQGKERIREKLAELAEALPDWVKRDWRWQEIVTACETKTR